MRRYFCLADSVIWPASGVAPRAATFIFLHGDSVYRFFRWKSLSFQNGRDCSIPWIEQITTAISGSSKDLLTLRKKSDFFERVATDQRISFRIEQRKYPNLPLKTRRPVHGSNLEDLKTLDVNLNSWFAEWRHPPSTNASIDWLIDLVLIFLLIFLLIFIFGRKKIRFTVATQEQKINGFVPANPENS